MCRLSWPSLSTFHLYKPLFGLHGCCGRDEIGLQNNPSLTRKGLAKETGGNFYRIPNIEEKDTASGEQISSLKLILNKRAKFEKIGKLVCAKSVFSKKLPSNFRNHS